MAAIRNEKGQFVKGTIPNPNGRPPKATEEEYRDAVKEVIPLERFKRQLEALAKRADRGDSRAFDKICGLLGLDVQKHQLSGSDGGAIQITIVDKTDE